MLLQRYCSAAVALLQHYCSATAALRPKPVKLKLLIGLLSGLGPEHNSSGKALAQAGYKPSNVIGMSPVI